MAPKRKRTTGRKTLQLETEIDDISLASTAPGTNTGTPFFDAQTLKSEISTAKTSIVEGESEGEGEAEEDAPVKKRRTNISLSLRPTVVITKQRMTKQGKDGGRSRSDGLRREPFMSFDNENGSTDEGRDAEMETKTSVIEETEPEEFSPLKNRNDAFQQYGRRKGEDDAVDILPPPPTTTTLRTNSRRTRSTTTTPKVQVKSTAISSRKRPVRKSAGKKQIIETDSDVDMEEAAEEMKEFSDYQSEDEDEKEEREEDVEEEFEEEDWEIDRKKKKKTTKGKAKNGDENSKSKPTKMAKSKSKKSIPLKKTAAKAKKGKGKGKKDIKTKGVRKDSDLDSLTSISESDAEEEYEDDSMDSDNEDEVNRRTAQSLRGVKVRAMKLRDMPKEDRARYKRMNWWERNQYHLEKNHPELKKIWKQIEQTAPTKTAPDKDFVQPKGLKAKMLPFQVEGLSWMRRQEKGPWRGGMLADEMGMGKTLQSIALILSDRDDPLESEDEERGKGNEDVEVKKTTKKLTLVVAPTVALRQWEEEIKKFTEGFKICFFHGANRGDTEILRNSDIILTSYAVLESCYRKQEAGFKRKGNIIKEESPLHQVKYHRIILDECHNIKDRQCNTAKAAFSLDSKYRWCLSGTPLQNRVGELYSLIRFLGADPFAFYYCKVCDCKSLHWKFSNKRDCDDCHHTPMQHVCFWNNDILKPIQKMGHSGYGAKAFEKLRLLLDRMMLRRTKVERAKDLPLPPRVVEIRRDFFTEEEEELYTSLFKDVRRNFTTYVEQGTVLNNYSNIFSLITKMRQMADHPDMVLKSKARRAAMIAAGQVMDDEVITCRICLDEADDPIISECRHIFCRVCVSLFMEEAEEREETAHCPACQTRMTIDLEGQTVNSEKATHMGRQGMLSVIDPSKWRTSTKIEALVEELSMIRTEDHSLKSLVFSQFTSFLDLVERRLLLAGYKVARLQGHMSPSARQNVIKYFDNTPDCTVFLISLKAGGVALNLTSASRVYIMDPWWNPAAELQAMDRIHRLGQERPVLVKRMVIENSIESKIIELQKKKESMVGAALGDDAQAMGNLTPEDLRFLFTN